MTAGDTDDFFADLAAQYINATLAVPVEAWDRDGRQGAHDLRYKQGGRSIAVEVKRILDKDFRQTEGKIAKREYEPVDRLRRLWDVRPRSGASVKRIRQHLPDLLILLEEIGWDERPLGETRRELLPDKVADRLDELGVSVAPMIYTGTKRGYIMQPETRWRFGEDELDELVDFTNDYLAGGNPEVVKLRGAAPERLR